GQTRGFLVQVLGGFGEERGRAYFEANEAGALLVGFLDGRIVIADRDFALKQGAQSLYRAFEEGRLCRGYVEVRWGFGANRFLLGELRRRDNNVRSVRKRRSESRRGFRDGIEDAADGASVLKRRNLRGLGVRRLFLRGRSRSAERGAKFFLAFDQ